MVTPLDRPLRRLVTIDDEPYVVTLDRNGLRLVRKGRRKGQEVGWKEILSGEVTLDAQLRSSLERERPPADRPARVEEDEEPESPSRPN